MRESHFDDDNRGVSITVSHVLTIGITTVLVAGLVIAAAGALTDQRERAAQSQLETIGQRFAFQVEQVDTLAATGDDPFASLTTDHTDRIVNSRYEVTLTNDTSVCSGDNCLLLVVQGSDTTAVVGVDLSVAVEESSAVGGEIRIVYDGRLKLEDTQ
jgi:hypothetical protein